MFGLMLLRSSAAIGCTSLVKFGSDDEEKKEDLGSLELSELDCEWVNTSNWRWKSVVEYIGGIRMGNH